MLSVSFLSKIWHDDRSGMGVESLPRVLAGLSLAWGLAHGLDRLDHHLGLGGLAALGTVGWWRAPDAVWNLPELSEHDIIVYLFLCRCSNRDGISFPSRKTIANACRISTDTVDRAIRHLEHLGLIKVERLRASNRYTILDLSEVAADSGLAAVSGQGSRCERPGGPLSAARVAAVSGPKDYIFKDYTIKDNNVVPPAHPVVDPAQAPSPSRDGLGGYPEGESSLPLAVPSPSFQDEGGPGRPGASAVLSDTRRVSSHQVAEVQALALESLGQELPLPVARELARYDPEYVREKMHLSQAVRGVRSIAGWLLAACRQDYRPQARKKPVPPASRSSDQRDKWNDEKYADLYVT